MPLSKKEKEILRSNKATIEAPKEGNQFIVQMSLTEGELMVLQDAIYSMHSSNAIAEDLKAYFRNALVRSSIWQK